MPRGVGPPPMSPNTENRLLDVVLMALVYLVPAYEEVAQFILPEVVVEETEEVRREHVENVPPDVEPATSSVWDDLAKCESGGNWQIDTGNGYYGGVQFSKQSWDWVGGSGYPNEHPREEQIRRAEILLERQGWGAWPACSRKLGLR